MTFMEVIEIVWRSVIVILRCIDKSKMLLWIDGVAFLIIADGLWCSKGDNGWVVVLQVDRSDDSGSTPLAKTG